MYAAAGKDSAASTMVGGGTGLLLAIALGVLVYRGSRRLDLARFFQITSVLLLAFAAYLLMGAVGELGEIARSGSLADSGVLIAILYVAGTVWIYLRPPAVLARALSR
jgi:high-affinity Fe2+/Pb2+ permease